MLAIVILLVLEDLEDSSLADWATGPIYSARKGARAGRFQGKLRSAPHAFFFIRDFAGAHQSPSRGSVGVVSARITFGPGIFMKHSLRFGFVSLVCSALAVTTLGVAATAPGNASAAAPKASAFDPASAPALTLAEAQQKIAAAPRYPAHPAPKQPGDKKEPEVKSPGFEMAAPPPAPRAEQKPAVPVAGHVWVPGHYMPVEGQWRWVMGEWGVPATPASVWIPARYDEKTRKWTPGYWQPDRPTPPEPDVAPQDAGKNAAPASARYEE